MFQMPFADLPKSGLVQHTYVLTAYHDVDQIAGHVSVERDDVFGHLEVLVIVDVPFVFIRVVAPALQVPKFINHTDIGQSDTDVINLRVQKLGHV